MTNKITKNNLEEYSLITFLRKTKNMGILHAAITSNQIYGRVVAANKNLCEQTSKRLIGLNCEHTLLELIRNEHIPGQIKFQASKKLIEINKKSHKLL